MDANPNLQAAAEQASKNYDLQLARAVDGSVRVTG